MSPTFTFETIAEVERQVGLVRPKSPGEEPEIGGLLVGDRDVVRAALPVSNSARRPRISYAPDPHELSQRLRQIEGSGAALRGSYHTHPWGRPTLSRADAVLAGTLGLLLVIAAPDLEEPACWNWGLYDSEAERIELTIAPPRSGI